MNTFKTILIGIVITLVVLLVVVGVIAMGTGLVALGSLAAYGVAGMFGWFTGVGYSTYFAVGILAWIGFVVFSLPRVGKRRFVAELYATHKKDAKAERRKRVDEMADAFGKMIEAQCPETKK